MTAVDKAQRGACAGALPRGNAAFVGKVSGDAALVLLLCPANEGGVEDEAILGSVALCLEGSEECLLSPKNLDSGGRVLGQVCQRACTCHS